MVAEIKKGSKFISHTIEYPIKAGKIPEEIKTIRVVGEFGSWNGWLDMKKSESGDKYVVDVSVRPGTTISYKFLINGNIWTSDNSDSNDAITDQDGHVMIVKKVLDTDDSSLKTENSKSDIVEQKREVSDEKPTNETTTTKTTTTTTTKTTTSTKKGKKEKKSFFKRLFSCVA
ncbi:hypothetical protein BCR32DRAFT_277037 [Anaeromyces robustus]|jgi:hypothetical protein|uniref:AMP-activated protein kinase glycogen-binding domain-containing protein n=1 Tax=Anaeromyces robustus TaxID=1754192 RepID=A0A1Y1XFK9_9FUNG|nr:hypothetical protein BCR32DRAFT_277037 [Anaeromyces robustus]|eukprot:ORX84535.1 hypothetical protein BCR32DRAFT_277037 [Anaeromyces robustus]